MSSKDLNFCTFEQTGETFHQQYWKRCYDCWPNEEKGACLHCIAVCHDGHTVDVKVKTGNFYCDCGHEKKCKLLSKNRHPIPSTHSVPPPSSCWGKIIMHPPGLYSGGFSSHMDPTMGG